VPKAIPAEQAQKHINNALKVLEGVGKDKADYAIRWAGIKLFKEVIMESPRDTGRFVHNWQITTKSPASKELDGTTTNTGAASRVISDFPKTVLGKKVFMVNNLPYAEVLELGGYPKTVEHGTYNKQTKSYEILSAGGYSKQAPVGMVRRNTKKLKKWLKHGLKLA